MIALVTFLSRRGSSDVPATGPLRHDRNRRRRCVWCRALVELALTMGAVTLVLVLALVMKILIYGWSHDHERLMVELARLLRP